MHFPMLILLPFLIVQMVLQLSLAAHNLSYLWNDSYCLKSH